jgi:hypothetical protein
MARYRRRYRHVIRRRMRGRDARLAGSAAAAGLVLAVVAGHAHAPPGGGRVSGTQLAAVRAAGGSETAFITAVLADLGAPGSQANVASLAAWFPHEFPSWPPAASWNPMASTLQMSGSTVYNSAGVQDYASAAEGAQATALTLGDGYYPLIVADLRSGRGLCGDGAIAAELLTWSGNGYSAVC